MTLSANLRPVTTADVDLLFDWVSRADSLAGKALTQDAITRPVHEAWLSRRLADSGTLMRIIELKGAPAGQVRLQRDEDQDAYSVDIYIDPSYRGRGLASWAIEHAIHELAGSDSNARIQADMKIDNGASAALFIRLGFSEAGRGDELIRFERRAAS